MATFTTVSIDEAEKGFIVVEASNVTDDVATTGLYPGQVAEWVSTTTAAKLGYTVRRVTAGSLNTTSGIAGAKIAGVVDTTIATGGSGRLQVFGPATVRASSSIDAAGVVVSYSINATNIGAVAAGVTTTLWSPAYLGGIVGWKFTAGTSVTTATQATVQLALM
tara:strand:+ start:105 stop:596 length:492 start_codon:yes stop_codon:yes gene_type:complete